MVAIPPSDRGCAGATASSHQSHGRGAGGTAQQAPQDVQGLFVVVSNAYGDDRIAVGTTLVWLMSSTH